MGMAFLKLIEMQIKLDFLKYTDILSVKLLLDFNNTILYKNNYQLKNFAGDKYLKIVGFI